MNWSPSIIFQSEQRIPRCYLYKNYDIFTFKRNGKRLDVGSTATKYTEHRENFRRTVDVTFDTAENLLNFPKARTKIFPRLANDQPIFGLSYLYLTRCTFLIGTLWRLWMKASYSLYRGDRGLMISEPIYLFLRVGCFSSKKYVFTFQRFYLLLCLPIPRRRVCT